MSDAPQFARFCAVWRTDPIAADTLLVAVVACAKAAGLKLAGVLQREVQRPGRRRHERGQKTPRAKKTVAGRTTATPKD